MRESKPALPDKIYFKIGEVADIVGVEPYVLRYWETEFSSIRPSKSRSQQRLYKKRDVELLLRIKELLYSDMYTIAGAKKQLLNKRPSLQMTLQLAERRDADLLYKVEQELKEILNVIESSDED
jgi:DNA-binding transcriptional MerR regulator